MSDAPLRDVPVDQGSRPQQGGGFANVPAAAPQTTGGYFMPRSDDPPQYAPQAVQGLTLEGIQQVMTQAVNHALGQYDGQLTQTRANELQEMLGRANQHTDQAVERIRQGLDDHISGVLDAVAATQSELERVKAAQDVTRARPEPQEPVQGFPAPRLDAYERARVEPQTLKQVGESPTDPVVEAKQEAKAMSPLGKEPVAIAGSIITLAAVVASWYGINVTEGEVESITTGVSLIVTAGISIVGTIGTLIARSQVNSPATEHIRDAKKAEAVITTLKLSGVEVSENLENKAIRKAVR